jgi:hypothetical protein
VDTPTRKSKKTWLWLLVALLVIAGSLAVLAFMPEPLEFEFLAGHERTRQVSAVTNDLYPTPEVYTFKGSYEDVVRAATRELPAKGWTKSRSAAADMTFTKQRSRSVATRRPAGYHGGVIFLDSIFIFRGKHPRLKSTYDAGDNEYVTVMLSRFGKDDPPSVWDRLLSFVGLGG